MLAYTHKSYSPRDDSGLSNGYTPSHSALRVLVGSTGPRRTALDRKLVSIQQSFRAVRSKLIPVVRLRMAVL